MGEMPFLFIRSSSPISPNLTGKSISLPLSLVLIRFTKSMYVKGLDLSSAAKPDVFVNEAAMQNNRHLSSSLLMESNPALLVMISLKFPKAEYLQPPRRSFVLVMCRSQNFNPCRLHPLPLPTKSSYLFVSLLLN